MSWIVAAIVLVMAAIGYYLRYLGCFHRVTFQSVIFEGGTFATAYVILAMRQYPYHTLLPCCVPFP
jgi:hypothetical protein